MQHIRTAVAAALVAAALLASCASNAPVTSGEESTPTLSSRTTRSTPLNRQEEAVLLAEHGDKIRQCLEDQGFTTVDVADGSGRWEVDQGGLDEATFEGVLKKCGESAGEVPIAPVTPEEASGMYDLNLEVKACLEAKGVTVPDPPSRAEWVETFLSGEPPWTPYSEPGVEGRYGITCGQPTLADLPRS